MEQIKKPSKRRLARETALQALYSWQVSQNPVEEIELAFVSEQDLKGVDIAYFRRLLRQTVHYVDSIDEAMAPYLDRELHELDPIEKALLRLAVYELKYELDVPYKVAINEAIEVAKVFGAEDSHKYVNGVLDKLAPVFARK